MIYENYKASAIDRRWHSGMGDYLPVDVKLLMAEFSPHPDPPKTPSSLPRQNPYWLGSTMRKEFVPPDKELFSTWDASSWLS